MRNAIASLEFLCLRADDGDHWGGRVASRGKKGVVTQLTEMERETLEMVSQRENNLGIFHAIGKVVYNKRDPPLPVDSQAQIPEHLQHSTQPLVSQVSVEDLLNETNTDIPTFIAALHENYILSCESPSFTDHLNGCIDYLSDSDLLNLDRGFASKASGGHGGSESLRQEEIAFQVAVRGLLFALPYPVKRRTAHGGKGRDAFKMTWPISLRVGRRKEEVESLVEAWHERYRISGDLISTIHGTSNGAEHNEPFRTNIPSTKDELLLDRLPYSAQISPCDPNLEEITTFSGIEKATDERLNNDAQGPAPTRSRFSKINDQRETLGAVERLPSQAEGKLWLSDDDIEDD